MPAPRILQFPPSLFNNETKIETTSGVVVVGANGSGKTRLGAWMEFQSDQAGLVHRISAQKSLAMPAVVSTSALDAAEADLLYGHAEAVPANYQVYKQGQRWGSKPETFLLNDYQKLMVYLFSEEFEISTQFRQAIKSGDTTTQPGTTKLDAVKRIWQDVLPHRELSIRAGMIEARVANGSMVPYNGSEMSDGERVIFYAIGQALAAPRGGILIIDEPEIHLHRAIQVRLWDAVERERPDCLFVYITHDLDFAASRLGMPKVWVKDFADGCWDWRRVPDSTGLPEELLLTVIGSRKPVLLCEGDRGSLDYAIYSHVYPAWTVVPCGSCEAVIHAAGTLSAMTSLHSLRCVGMIDRDQRSNNEVEHLRTLGVYSINYSEAENLLVSADVVRAIASHLAFTNIEDIAARVKNLVLESLERDKSRVAADMTRGQVELMIRRIKTAGETRDEVVASVEAFTDVLDVGLIYDAGRQAVEAILAARDVSQALKVYHHKGLLPQIGSLLGMKPTEYSALVKRLVAGGNSSVRNVLRDQLPTLV